MDTNRLETLKQLEIKQPGDAFVKYAIGLEYMGLNKPEDALKYFELLVNNFPDYLATYLQIGNLYEQLGQKGLAIGAYKRGIEIAKTAGDKKTLGELNEALVVLED